MEHARDHSIRKLWHSNPHFPTESVDRLVTYHLIRQPGRPRYSRDRGRKQPILLFVYMLSAADFLFAFSGLAC
jgi:hypothetical protein